MNTQQLKARISYLFSGYGHKKVSIEYKGKEYTCISTNTLATDRLTRGIEGIDSSDNFYRTEKSALLALWNECKMKNNLK